MSVNHKLYNKIKKSKDIDKTIEKEEKKILNKMKKLKEANNATTQEGFMSYKLYLLFSQYTTLDEIKKNPNLSYDNIVNAGKLWAIIYMNFLKKKYDKNLNDIQLATIIKNDAKK
jgi:hypothetical protein